MCQRVDTSVATATSAPTFGAGPKIRHHHLFTPFFASASCAFFFASSSGKLLSMKRSILLQAMVMSGKWGSLGLFFLCIFLAYCLNTSQTSYKSRVDSIIIWHAEPFEIL